MKGKARFGTILLCLKEQVKEQIHQAHRDINIAHRGRIVVVRCNNINNYHNNKERLAFCIVYSVSELWNIDIRRTVDGSAPYICDKKSDADAVMPACVRVFVGNMREP